MVTLTVVYEKYGRSGGDSGARIKTYTGESEVDVLKEILERHSYGVPELCEGEEELTAKIMWDSLQDLNGDGCDYIIAVLVGEPTFYTPTAC